MEANGGEGVLVSNGEDGCDDCDSYVLWPTYASYQPGCLCVLSHFMAISVIQWYERVPRHGDGGPRAQRLTVTCQINSQEGTQ